MPAPCINIELVIKDKIKPPNPWEMLGGVEPLEDGNIVRAICGLRANQGSSYMRFCVHFLDCVCTDEEWKRNSRNTRISNYIEESLEAFGVITYVNGYDVWNQRYKEGGGEGREVGTDEENTTTSTLTPDTIKFRFTSGARGSRKYNGWTKEGMELFNKVKGVLAKQRKEEVTGAEFDDKLMETLCTKRKRTRAGDDNDEAPRAENNLTRLMQKQGL
jgi:hypothetical protein